MPRDIARAFEIVVAEMDRGYRTVMVEKLSAAAAERRRRGGKGGKKGARGKE